MTAALAVGTAQRPVEIHYASGSLSVSGTLDGEWEKDGRWMQYHPQGTEKRESHYAHGRPISAVEFDSLGRKTMEVDYHEDGSVTFMAYHPNGLKASHSNIHPDLLVDSLSVQDRPYFVDRFDDNGLFVSQYIHLPFIDAEGLPYHRFHGRTRLAEIRAVENTLSWYPYAGISSAQGVFDAENGERSLHWPERGVSDDAATVEFDRAGKGDNRLQPFFVDGLPYGNWLNYYPNGQLWYSINYKDGLLDGEFKSHYFSGQLAMECRFVAGRPEGEVRQWYADGSQKSVCNYSNGVADGEWKRWEDGQLVEHRTYVKGQAVKESTIEDGVVRSVDRLAALNPQQPSTQEVSEDGRLIHRAVYGMQERYDAQGRLYARTPLLGLAHQQEPDGSLRVVYMENGRPTGFSLLTDTEGIVRSATYSFSPMDSMTVDYSVSGEPAMTMDVSDGYETKAVESLFKKLRKDPYLPMAFSMVGKRAGRIEVAYPNGKKWTESDFVDGLQQGTTTVWDVNGQEVAQGDFSAGRPVGIHRRWTAAGLLIDERQYDNGRLEGVHRRWDPDTGELLLEESYLDGVLQGSLKEYAPDGILLRSEEYLAGQLSGRVSLIDEQGEEVGHRTFEAGKLNGPAEESVSDGSRGKGHYRDGRRHGPWELTTGDGVREVFFFEGRELTGSDPERCLYDIDLPLVSMLASPPPFSGRLSYSQFQMWTSGQLSIDESDYLSLRDLSVSTTAEGTAVLAIPDELFLECAELPGFLFDLAPLSGIAEYTELPLEWERKDYFLRQYPRFADSSFTGSALDYYHLGADHYTLDERSLIDMTGDALAANFDLHPDTALAIIHREIVKQGILPSPPPPDHWPETADAEQTMTDLREVLFILSIDADLSTRTPVAMDKVDDLYRPVAGEDFRLQMDKRMSQYTIDLRPDVVHLMMPPHQLSATTEAGSGGAVLSMRPSMLRFNTESGMSNVSATDYCFAEGHIGGSRFSLDFDSPQVILRPRKLRELISDTQDYYFYAENLGLEFSGVFAAEAWGRFETSDGKTVFLEFTNLGITDKYLAGRLKIDLPEELSHEVFKEMEKAFTYHEIISEWNGLEIYFMRLKPKEGVGSDQ